ncbi:MAG: hypothetical protein EBQ82_06155 [Betaproteobacteria bacterium]|nr:hypothetical protein [Betaproteobacteria bacterium]NBY04967.1 hypothetical protein [Betaproteobacteria bacterium]
MNKLYLIGLSMCLLACQNKGVDTTEIDELRTQVQMLEQKVKNLEEASKPAGGWMLWVSTEWVDKRRPNQFGSPKRLSAFDSREDCQVNAKKYVLPQGQVTNEDPYTLSDGRVSFVYNCMPSHVDMRPRAP